MNAEYRRLENEAREAWGQLIEQAASAAVTSAADARQLEEQILRETMRIGSMVFGMILVRSVQDDHAQQADEEFVDSLPKKFHSQGKRTVIVSLRVAGRRVVVTTDGGRVRLREKARGKTKRGRRRFQAQWREPRLFMISTTDDNGRQDPALAPIIDGGMGSCDELFALLLAYLQGPGITKAPGVQFVADGAAWIWNRVPGLIETPGLQDDQVQQLIDFWHAVEYLGKLADSSKLDTTGRKRWIRTQKKRLLRGEIGSVVHAIMDLTRRRRTTDQTTWLNDFITHGLDHRRMDYSTAKDHNMPIGSGAIESAIRRVINLRVKGHAIYWLRENAETMIRIRAWIKAGRAEEQFQQTTYVTPKLAL